MRRLGGMLRSMAIGTGMGHNHMPEIDGVLVNYGYFVDSCR